MYPETAQFYDFFAQSQQESVRRAEFVNSQIKKQLKNESNFIIDIGAGTGEIAFLLADGEHSLFCFEPSSSMYAILLERLRTRKDLHSLVSTFPCRLNEVANKLMADVAYAFSVMSHVSLEERKAVLTAAHRHLKPGGLLLLNFVQYTSQRVDQPRALVQEKKLGHTTYRHFAESRALTVFQRQITFEYEVVFNGQILKKYKDQFILNLDKPRDVEELLRESGFKTLHCYSNYEMMDYDQEAPGFVIAATSV